MQEAASPPSATQSSEFIEELPRQGSNSLGATPSRSVSNNVSFSSSARFPPPSQINERSDSRSKWLPAESSHYRPCQLAVKVHFTGVTILPVPIPTKSSRGRTWLGLGLGLGLGLELGLGLGLGLALTLTLGLALTLTPSPRRVGAAAPG